MILIILSSVEVQRLTILSELQPHVPVTRRSKRCSTACDRPANGVLLKFKGRYNCLGRSPGLRADAVRFKPSFDSESRVLFSASVLGGEGAKSYAFKSALKLQLGSSYLRWT